MRRQFTTLSVYGSKTLWSEKIIRENGEIARITVTLKDENPLSRKTSEKEIIIDVDECKLIIRNTVFTYGITSINDRKVMVSEEERTIYTAQLDEETMKIILKDVLVISGIGDFNNFIKTYHKPIT